MTTAPKYLAIAQELRTRCQSMPIGSRLAPERTLAEEFDVSVMTMRRALETLVNEGWLQRATGRGTFVRRPTVTMGPTLSSFTEDMQRRGFTPSSRVLRVEVVDPDVEARARMNLHAGEQALLVERLRFADAEPMCHEVGLYPDRLRETLLSADLTGSIHAILGTIGVEPRATERTVRAVVATGPECELLSLPLGSPSLEITDLFLDGMGRAMQYVRSRYRFDRYETTAIIRSSTDESLAR